MPWHNNCVDSDKVKPRQERGFTLRVTQALASEKMMGLRDLFRRKRVQAESERPTQVNSRPIGVKTVGDYLHYVGNVLDVNLKDATNYRGRLVDLSADCSKLILRDVTEYDISSTHREVTLAKHDRVLIPVADVNLVEVKDRGIQTE